MSFWSAFSSASKEAPKPEGPSGPAVPAQPTQMGQSKPVPVGHASLAHPHHHEGPTDLDLYRTFSPSDVGMWSWQATTDDGPGNGRTGFWGKLFSSNSTKTSS